MGVFKKEKNDLATQLYSSAKNDSGVLYNR